VYTTKSLQLGGALGLKVYFAGLSASAMPAVGPSDTAQSTLEPFAVGPGDCALPSFPEPCMRNSSASASNPFSFDLAPSNPVGDVG